LSEISPGRRWVRHLISQEVLLHELLRKEVPLTLKNSPRCLVTETLLKKLGIELATWHPQDICNVEHVFID
jgi:hypothetical protein